jgi:DNA (cytosine-5)-methyltransferase 1
LVVLLENVIQYQSSASAAIMRTMLRDMGYDVHELVLKGREFGAIEDRDRFCLVAITRGIEFDVTALDVPVTETQPLGSVLELVSHDDPRWSEMAGLKAKQERDMEAGKGFKMQVFDALSHRIGTITKGYAKVRSTDPKIRHPDNPDLLRQLTPIEHARVKQIPERLIAGLSNTVAHEVLGQSVVYKPFVALGVLIAKSLKAWCTAMKDGAACASAMPRVACG